MKRKGRKRLPRETRRNEILAAAKVVFSMRGYEAATIAEVAASAGTVEGNVYRYFETKRDLLATVISNWYEATIVELESETNQIKGARERLRFLIHYHILALKENPGLLGLIIREVRTHNDAYESIIGGLNRRYTGFLSQAIRDGIDEGVFRANIQVPLVRDMIFGCIEHHTWRYISMANTADMDVESMTERLLSVIREGIETEANSNDRQKYKRLARERVDEIREMLEKM